MRRSSSFLTSSLTAISSWVGRSWITNSKRRWESSVTKRCFECNWRRCIEGMAVAGTSWYCCCIARVWVVWGCKRGCSRPPDSRGGSWRMNVPCQVAQDKWTPATSTLGWHFGTPILLYYNILSHPALWEQGLKWFRLFYFHTRPRVDEKWKSRHHRIRIRILGESVNGSDEKN